MNRSERPHESTRIALPHQERVPSAVVDLLKGIGAKFGVKVTSGAPEPHGDSLITYAYGNTDQYHKFKEVSRKAVAMTALEAAAHEPDGTKARNAFDYAAAVANNTERERNTHVFTQADRKRFVRIARKLPVRPIFIPHWMKRK